MSLSSPSPIVEEPPWWRRSHKTAVMLATRLSREECVRRLRDSVDPLWKPFGRPVMGRVSEDGAVLRRRTWYRNSFQSLARVSFGDKGGGTRIACWFGMNQLVLLLLAVMAIVVAAGFAGYLSTRMRAGDATVPLLPFLIMPLALATGLGVAWIIGRRAAATDRAFLLEFLKTTLSAQEIS